MLSLGLLVFAIAWVAGVWQITPAFEFKQAVRRGFSQSSRLRQAARWMQFAWPAAVACMLFLGAFAGSSPILLGMMRLLLLVCVLLGLTGLIVLSLLFEELADWTCDDTAERFFRGSQWGIACGALVIVLAVLANAVMPNAILTGILRIASFFAAFMLLASIATYLYALLSLSKSVTLSLYHAKEHQQRLRRREQRLRQQAAAE